MNDRKTYNLTTGELLAHSLSIAKAYEAQNLRLTVRQLYYQLVARGLELNGDHVYKRLVSVLSTARLDGRFPMHLIEDRGRDVGQSILEAALNVRTAADNAASDLADAYKRHLWAGVWFGQSVVPYVWVEKDALAGVFTDPCKNHDVGLFACKGYPSLQSLWSWMEGVARAVAAGREDEASQSALEDLGIDPEGVWDEVVVLYFGDHDPDGLEIPDSALRNIRLLEEHHWHKLPTKLPKISFERIALTREQILEHAPPPFPAKESSARYAQYVLKTGLKDAWELDALDPATLQGLITSEIQKFVDFGIYDQVRVNLNVRRDAFRKIVCDPEWAKTALERED